MRLRYCARPSFALKASWLAVVLACLLVPTSGASLAAAQAPASPPSATALGDRLAALVREAALGDKVGISVVDLASGARVLEHNVRTPLNPASNMKLLTAAAAMIELGPAYRSRTGLYGRIVQSSVVGGLCLKGQGDPTLVTADLVAFAQRLADEGVREVDEVVVDGTYFDDQVLPPAFDQQPNEVSPFRAAVAAAAVNASAYTLRVRPGATDGAAALVSVDGSGYFEIENGLVTRAGALPNVIADQRAQGDKLSLRLRGTLPLGSASLAYARRVESPLHYAGHVLVDALRALRIQAPKRVVVGACASGTPLITSKASPALAEVLARLGKDSDNFVAEMVLKVLGAERKRKPGRSQDGATVVVEALGRMNVPLEGLAMVNGSGLFNGNAVSAEQLSRTLVAMHENPSLRDDYVAHLAVGGADGTLVRRFLDLPVARTVRAKTGTLNDVIALSGYVLGRKPGEAFAFAFVANGVSGKHAQARGLIDNLVRELASVLHARPSK